MSLLAARRWPLALGVLLAGLALGLATASIAAADHQDPLLSDGFEDGEAGPDNWSEVNPPGVKDDCGAAEGELALMFGGIEPRFAETRDLDVEEGGAIDFAIRFGSGFSFPCKGDEDRDVILEYSTDGGDVWHRIDRIDDDAHDDGWHHLTYEIPDGAQTDDTRFRWVQLGPNERGRQQWALDAVEIGPLLGPPTDVTATPGPDGTVEVTWAPPASDGGHAPSGYVVERATGDASFAPIAQVDADQRSVTDEDRRLGTTYAYRVLAITEAGTSPASEPAHAPGTAAPDLVVGQDQDGLRLFDDADGDGEADAGETWLATNGTSTQASPPTTALATDPDRPVAPVFVQPQVGPACSPADVVCAGSLEPPPSRTDDVPALDPRAAVTVENVTVDLTVPEGQTTEVGPIGTTIAVPGIAEVPVTVCRDGCPVPATPEASVDGDLRVVLDHGGTEIALETQLTPD